MKPALQAGELAFPIEGEAGSAPSAEKTGNHAPAAGDYRAVGELRHAEALVATASGLIVALLALFPYMGFGAQREITIGRLESLIAVAQLAWGASLPPPAG